jgi:hypothetical protein
LAQVVEDLAHEGITAPPSHVGIYLNRHLRADKLELRDGRWHVVDRSAASAPTSSPHVASTRVLELRRTPARRRAVGESADDRSRDESWGAQMKSFRLHDPDLTPPRFEQIFSVRFPRRLVRLLEDRARRLAINISLNPP